MTAINHDDASFSAVDWRYLFIFDSERSLETFYKLLFILYSYFETFLLQSVQ